ncbi:hypothetical protein AVEN_178553-1 [Araneus ventricosus]|uniref:Uncharacterized protein n=1 Tax=Araneus ventricosus TaxID=182803 RepID=A0A4Y2HHK0_ARAVE|nr:hypothetical protein AVEN_178553-1 [Araneus ventricosus]
MSQSGTSFSIPSGKKDEDGTILPSIMHCLIAAKCYISGPALTNQIYGNHKVTEPDSKVGDSTLPNGKYRECASNGFSKVLQHVAIASNEC